MTPVLRKRSLADTHNLAAADPPVPTEYNDADYIREVLQLRPGQTEVLLDEHIVRQAGALGITISQPVTAKVENVIDNSMSDSVVSHHARTLSSGSQRSQSTGMTSRSSHDYHYHLDAPQSKRRPGSRRRSLSFTDYEKFLVQAEASNTATKGAIPVPPEPAPSLFSVSTKKSYASIKRGLNRLRIRRGNTSAPNMNSCVCCREEFKGSESLYTLPCVHKYCNTCLRVLITQSMNDESKMPPRCCTQPIPGSIIQRVLTKDDQYTFIKSVVQFSTPWEARIYCPSPACGEFIPRRKKVDPKAPFEVSCRKCGTRVCSTCKRIAHGFGQDCPADMELDAVLKMGEKSGWKRCYKCRNMVELHQGCSHITCRCKAQFCYICGAVWDLDIGCPNFCNGEEELERRRLEEEARMIELEKEKAAREEEEKIEAAERAQAERRTANSRDLNTLRERQLNERDRFTSFQRRMKWMMWTRHGQAKLDVLDRYAEALTKMKERHARTSTHLEDRQVAAEMELRATHKQSERSVKIRLRHMEAYCDGIGRDGNEKIAARVVTERDLRELGQQYNLRDDMERLHQSKINVMRDKQAKQMDQLLSRQDEELAKLATKQEEELDILEQSFVDEEDGFFAIFQERKMKLRIRWDLTEEIWRKKLEARNKVKYAPIIPVEFEQDTLLDDGLASVVE